MAQLWIPQISMQLDWFPLIAHNVKMHMDSGTFTMTYLPVVLWVKNVFHCSVGNHIIFAAERILKPFIFNHA